MRKAFFTEKATHHLHHQAGATVRDVSDYSSTGSSNRHNFVSVESAACWSTGFWTEVHVLT